MAKKKSSPVASMSEGCCSPAKETAADRKRRETWQAEDDARTLQRADEVRNDPLRMKRVRNWAQEQLDSIGAIAKK